jgi:tetratricopeptide (TPR) repeat protein
MEDRIAMNPVSPHPLARRTLLVIVALTAGAIASFAAVSRLVTRLKANEKRIAWRASEAGLTEVRNGRPELALDDFRAALSYDPDNPEYQLSLARALRDTGRLDESEAYLLHLWNSTPQDSTVNLALGRLAVRRRSVDDAIRYYHSAIYGFWPIAPDQNRRQARFELIDFLLQKNALPQAQAELIALAQVLTADPEQHLRVAGLFTRAQDMPNALAQYQSVLKAEPKNSEALAGAGSALFQMGRYRSAQHYLQKAAAPNPMDPQVREQLQTAESVLAADPFLGRLSDKERNRRIAAAFEHAGNRLKTCAQAKQIDLPAGSPASNANAHGSDLLSLWSSWVAAKPELRRLSALTNMDMPDTLMDLVFEIEQKTSQQCGDGDHLDQALLRIARDRESVDQ